MNVSAADVDTGTCRNDRPGGQERRLLIRRVETEADGVISLDLGALDRGPLPAWEPGAHVSVRLRSGLVREYSLCGDPRDRRTYRIAVLEDPLGRGGSREVHRTAVPGSTLSVSGPRNSFALRPAASYRFIAGGIGITPILPMVQYADRRAVDWTLLYGGRSCRSMAFVDDLRSFGAARLTLVPEDRHGLPDIAGFLAGAAAATAVYCCGPPGLIQAVQQRCQELGLLGSLHLERFGPPIPSQAEGRSAEPAAPDRAIDVELCRSGKKVSVAPGRSILSAVREVVPQHPSSCEEGYCGTCETQVLDGVPEHRDTVLSDEERARGDRMMICVSRALTSMLALDL